MKSFAGKVAVVTGGGSGIGRALALALARDGARIVVADVDDADAGETARLAAAAGAEAMAVRTDVADRRQVEGLADRVYERFRRDHVLCNNAGVVVHGGLEAATWEDWQWVMGVNLWGVVTACWRSCARMVAGGEGGHVVNTASMAGLIASQGLGVYKHHQVRRRRTLRDTLEGSAPARHRRHRRVPDGRRDAHPAGGAQPARALRAPRAPAERADHADRGRSTRTTWPRRRWLRSGTASFT